MIGPSFQRRRLWVLAVFCVLLLRLPLSAKSVPPTLSQRLDRLVSEAYPPNQPGVAVLVRRGDEIVLRKGYGLANVEWGIPIDSTTVFALGSISKQFTAVAILRLVQAGKISLDDPITRFFPEFPAYLRSVNVEHLLTHTSGLKSYTSLADYERWNRLDINSKQILKRIVEAPLDSNPGEEWSYSDSGYFLLGLLLEKLHGKSYSEVIQEQIFQPLGMKHSICDEPGLLVPQRASGYVVDGKVGFWRAPYLSPRVSYAAGALLSNVDDLALWSASLDDNRLVRHELLERAFTPYRLSGGSSTFYGYAWAISNYEGHQFVEHGGRISGFQAHILRVPDARILVIMLSNALDHKPDPDFLAPKIATYLLGKPYDPTAMSMQVSDAIKYTGSYRTSPGTIWRITLEGDRLYYMNKEGAAPLEIFAKGGDEFFFANSFARLRFERDRSGHVVRLVLLPQYGSEIQAEKETPTPVE